MLTFAKSREELSRTVIEVFLVHGAKALKNYRQAQETPHGNPDNLNKSL